MHGFWIETQHGATAGKEHRGSRRPLEGIVGRAAGVAFDRALLEGDPMPLEPPAGDQADGAAVGGQHPQLTWAKLGTQLFGNIGPTLLAPPGARQTDCQHQRDQPNQRSRRRCHRL